MKKIIISIFSLLIAVQSWGLEIAVSSNPSKYEKIAASELQLFLKQILGEDIKIINENNKKNKNVIFLGQTQFAKDNNVNGLTLDDEEWFLKSVGNNLIISGGRPVGTLYGVYSFLDKLGVKFLTYDETVVPKKEKMSLKGFNEQRKPAFEGRNIFDHTHTMLLYQRKLAKNDFEKKYALWRLRSMSNGNQSGFKGLYIGKHSNLKSNYHNFYLYVPYKKYFDKHPEYFSMNIEGKRFHGNPQEGQLCLSNSDVTKITVDSLKKFIEEDRKSKPKEDWFKIYDISAQDGFGYICLCPKCKELVKETGSIGGLVLQYINAVAREIHKEYPDIMIRTFAYSHAELAPTNIKPEKNVIVQYCDLYTRRDCYRPIDIDINKEQAKKIEDWAKIGTNLMIWTYWNMGMRTYFWPPRIETITDAIGPDLRFYHKNGVIALFHEAEKGFLYPQNFMNLNYYLASRLMVDLSLNDEDIIKEFMDNYYGGAAPLMIKFLNSVRKGVKEHPTVQKTMLVSRWKFITPQYMLDTYKLFKEAQKATKDTKYLARVNEEFIPVLWQLFVMRADTIPLFEKNGISFETLKNECYNITANYIKSYGGEYQKHLKEMNYKFSILTAPPLPVPKQFKNVDERDIKIFGHTSFVPKATYQTVTVDDPSSTTGKALRASRNDYSYMHGVNGQDPRSKIWATNFAVSNLDALNRTQRAIKIEDIPQDEKYHWYKIPKAIIGSKTTFWGHFWYLVIDLSLAYSVQDGVDDANIYDTYFSAKFTGPAYVKNSKEENAIYVDLVVLVKPDVQVNLDKKERETL